MDKKTTVEFVARIHRSLEQPREQTIKMQALPRQIRSQAKLALPFVPIRELAQKVKPASPEIDFAAAALAFLLFAPWVVRDFDECGLQILLLFFLSMAARSLFRGAQTQTGAWPGLAATFKLTPILLVPLLIWKRRFVEAGAVICFVVIFNVLLPSLIWGPNLAHDVLVRHFETLKTIAKSRRSF